MHLRMCRLCAAFRRDQHTLHERMSSDDGRAELASFERKRATLSSVNKPVALSAEAKQRMKKCINDSMR